MGRWGDTLRAYASSRDTADTVDISPVERASGGGSVRGVNSVNGSAMDRSKAFPGGWPGEASVMSAVSTARGKESTFASIDLGLLPDTCGVCGGLRLWRESAIERPVPGPWCCVACDPAPPGVWQDGAAIPRAETEKENWHRRMVVFVVQSSTAGVTS